MTSDKNHSVHITTQNKLTKDEGNTKCIIDMAVPIENYKA